MQIVEFDNWMSFSIPIHFMLIVMRKKNVKEELNESDLRDEQFPIESR